MAHSNDSYEGFYARFDTPSKKEGSLMTGADDLVGADYTVEFHVEDGRKIAWLKNKFGAERAFLDEKTSQRLQLAEARGRKIRVLLSFLAYSDTPEPGIYWGEVAVFCFDPRECEGMDAFIDRIALKLADGIRPDINLGSSAVTKALTDPNWVPKATVPLPKKKTGLAILKQQRSLSEKMVEEGRAGNKGCYAVSWLFIIVVVALIAWGVLTLAGVL